MIKRGFKAKKKFPVRTVSVKLSPPLSFPAAKWDPFALGYALALLSGIWMLALSVLGKSGYFLKHVEMMQSFFPYYSLSLSGIVIGVALVTLCGLLCGLLLAWAYNKFS